MRASAIILAVAAGVVSAQDPNQNYTSSLDMTINPGLVDLPTRSDWCTAQSNTCDQLCDQSSETNRCSIDDLSYNCTCSSNNSAPGLEYYTGTMPTFICKELFSECIETNAGDADAQDACKENIDAHCGRLDPADADVSSGDDNEDDGDDSSSEETTTNTTTSPPEETGETDTTPSTTAADDLAAPTAAPKAAAVLAAVGMLAYLV